MALWIQNITSPDRPDSQPNVYKVAINNDPPLAVFVHVPDHGAAACLRAAAEAIDKANDGRPRTRDTR